MTSTWHSLAWKEWHEHKWKLAAIATTMWGVVLSVLPFQHAYDVYDVVAPMCMLCIVPLSLFIGFGAAANERSRRTLPFLQTLPAPLWQVAIVKLFFGIVTLFIPILLTVLAAYASMLIAPAWQPRALESMMFCLPLAASLFIWAAATGGNRKDEVSAAAVSLSVMVGWPLLLIAIAHVGWAPFEPARWFVIASLSSTPAGFALPISKEEWLRFQIIAISLSLLTHLLLCMWYVARFGHVTNREVRSRVAIERAGKAPWLAPPRRTTLSATAWKQFRESGPIVLLGLAGAVAITTIAVVVSFIDRGDARVFAESGVVYTNVAVVMSFFIALVLGIGVCHADMEPQLNTFWRTRPINPDVWFWTKFITGLTLLLVATYLPNLVLAWLGNAKVSANMSTSPFVTMLAQIAVFASAVAIACLVRHAVYAAILTIPVVYLGAVLIWLAVWTSAHVGWQNSWPENPMQLSDLQLTWGFGLSFLFSTALAWLAMRNDWGRKSRY